MCLIKYAFDEQRIATITFNRDEKRNAINEEMAGQILDRLEDAEKDDVRVVILRANAGVNVWSAGHDVSELNPFDLYSENPTLKLSRKIQSVPFPVIAMVEGSVHGGGVILLLSADIVMAAENADLAIASNKLGIPLSIDVHAYWLRVMGIHKAKELLFTAGVITAKDAYHAGLYNRVTNRSELEQVTKELAQRITRCSPEAVAATKRQLNLIAAQSSISEEGRTDLAEQSSQVLQSLDTKERIAAILKSLNGNR
ncbi:MAG: enoyl-CoA hydratase/isomerase family protein [Planctomycetaceae bacterium]|nr:enoyl-CoA hydratase/isomerase family protein [Planctomycetales bacterium]MCB9921642.1 enoyl-CoA hydratase/isomerase family protein [Planctomycetaceae bacterium]